MYLLHTTDLTLKSFYAEIPDYAILSHTWNSQESTLQDVQNRGNDGWKEPAGWKKVEGACAHAKKYGWKWIWIDSCCIDKSSSAELSENINSMYQLYENAGVCYVYLSDASSKDDPRDPGSDFRYSRWFTRGWTLQELIAPSASVVFLDHLWKEIGTRYSLRDVISAITSIPVGLLEDGDLTKYSIAQKMSWGAFRKTTRPEDRAYSLMGLFDICMPPIYGEGGDKAFMRLQQEIIKTSNDRSIFAWVVDCKRNRYGRVIEQEPRGLLARSPDQFKGSGRVGISKASFAEHTSSFSFNNNGLHIHFPVVPIDAHDANIILACQADGDICDMIVRASLNCQVDGSGEACNIYLRKTAERDYVRYRPDKLVLRSFETPKNVQEVVVKETLSSRKTRRVYHGFYNRVRLLPLAEECFENVTCTVEDGQRVIPSGFRSSHSFTVDLGYHHSNETVRISFPAPEEGARHADRLRIELGSGGFVTAALHPTGQGGYLWPVREVEIDYTTSSLIPTLRCPQSQFIEIPSDSLDIVFPPNHSDHGSSACHYLSLSTFSACRILEYYGSIAIAIGINESGEVWVHLPQRISGETIEEIWGSYQENASRAPFRDNASSSSMTDLYGTPVTVYKNDGLQFASHSLVIT